LEILVVALVVPAAACSDIGHLPPPLLLFRSDLETCNHLRQFILGQILPHARIRLRLRWLMLELLDACHVATIQVADTAANHAHGNAFRHDEGVVF
jgi:hypothetical protein